MTVTPHGPAGRGVAALRKADKIGDPEVLAAERWYRDFTLGAHGVFDGDVSPAGGGDAHTAGFARAKANQAIREASAAVGDRASLILAGLIVDDLTFSALAAAVGLSRNEVVGAAWLALHRLSEHYAGISPVGRDTGTRSADFSACNLQQDDAI